MTRSIVACASCLRRTLQVAHPARAAGSLRALQFRSASTAVSSAPRSLGSLQKDGGDDAGSQKRASERLDRVVKMEMKHLTLDPLKVVEQVRHILRRNAFDEALLLTQKVTQKKVECGAAWNELMAYCGREGRLTQAFKLFNDMKKRGQKPSVYTYTALFVACVKSPHPKQAVAEAVKLYNMMLHDPRIKPTTIHLNSALNVCAKANDLDSMFLLVDSINSKDRKADERTYTIIFNSFVSHVRQGLKDLSPEDRKDNALKVVGQARALWNEVMNRRQKGEFPVDEEAVCSMCRVLVHSPLPKDRTEVFEIIHQTMGLPNLYKNPGAATDSAGGTKAVAPTKNAILLVPTYKTLSILLTTAGFLRETTTGVKYWNLLIRQYGIVPDLVNWKNLFSMLGATKSSAHSVASLKLLPDKYVKPEIYAQVMKTCLLDGLNQNVIKNANDVLADMSQRLPVPDILTMRIYIRLAMSAHKRYRTQARSGDIEDAKRAYGTQILIALGHVWPLYQKAHEWYFTGRRARNPSEESKLHNERREVIAIARQMSSAFNKVVSERMVPEDELQQIRPVNAQLGREIQQFYEQRDDAAKKLPKRRGLDREEEALVDEAKMKEHYGNTFIWDTVKAAQLSERGGRGESEDAGEEDAGSDWDRLASKRERIRSAFRRK